MVIQTLNVVFYENRKCSFYYILWQFSSNPIIAKVGDFLMFTFIFFWNMYRIRNNKQGNKLDKKE